MTIYKPPGVELEPECRMRDWSIQRISTSGSKGFTDHVVGYNTTAQEGRVSSPIQSFNPKDMVVTTSSGRSYLLVGDPGYSADGHWVFHQWKYLGQVTDDMVEDVTEEYKKQEDAGQEVP